MEIEPIGVIHSPYTSLENMPIQPRGAEEALGEIILYPQFGEGLNDLEGFSHLYLLYHFHQAKRTALSVVPFMDDTARGVFATRSPLRPNHLGISIVELHKVSTNRITVRGIDILDGTPLLDIKPYIEAFDGIHGSRSGWMQQSKEEVAAKRSDSRFV
jgi:tRNA-Thr(GGU) m(6)t(6)A37 methyltransferase TsaA